MFNGLHLIVLGWQLVVSVVTYIFYAVDKTAAQNNRWRTPESTLHILALLGGWPGALMAQQRLRHKSKKQPFRFVFWITVLLSVIAFVWLITEEGKVLQSVFVDWLL